MLTAAGALMHYLATAKLDVYFCDGVRSGAGKQWLRRVKSNIINRFLKLLAMNRDLLDTSLALNVPQSD